ncbi:hypothetical protein [Chondrinema litorale]|uniref:hypothetical protein n=1 Tax=Chondrinema litorale TaxID=2994555 RepID=UPI002542DA6B|nr:hypothetical protein [Chondrinema litorale]UZR99618.1 hypothetical protein OQ292_37145 [Chondrinema litorale]
MRELLFILFFQLIFFQAYSQGVSIVKDKGVNRQLESMVYLKWSKKYFRPRWYYMLFHNKYRTGEDRRTINQLLPTLAFIELTEDATEDQSDDTDFIFNKEMFKQANIEGEAAYHLHFKKIINDLNRDIDEFINELNNYAVNTDIIKQFDVEKERINSRIDALRNGNLMPGDLANGLEIEAKKLSYLKGRLYKFLQVVVTINKYETLYK